MTHERGTLDPQTRTNLIGLGMIIVLGLVIVALLSGGTDLRGPLNPTVPATANQIAE